MVVDFTEVSNYVTIQSSYAGKVNCGFPNCPMQSKMKGKGKEYLPCSARLTLDEIYKGVKLMLDRTNRVREHYKGLNRCEIAFNKDEWEWETELLEGENPEGMCEYTGGGTLEEDLK